MFDGYDLYYSDEETRTLLVKRHADGAIFQAYHNGEQWVGDRVEIEEREDGEYLRDADPAERVVLWA